ncbi:hypothetical protein ABT288_37020 [Streptomyces sp. NPDC001093]|uniref:hypothetical protein n=1 Tax=Streptomyces sp. NPDC001093 TaxID=3154376 RepID=UPI00332D0016
MSTLVSFLAHSWVIAVFSYASMVATTVPKGMSGKRRSACLTREQFPQLLHVVPGRGLSGQLVELDGHLVEDRGLLLKGLGRVVEPAVDEGGDGGKKDAGERDERGPGGGAVEAFAGRAAGLNHEGGEGITGVLLRNGRRRGHDWGALTEN